jgi:hypothetical protein
MNMADRLTILSNEIFHSIACFTYSDPERDISSLSNLSCVSKAIRQQCLPVLFHYLTVTFSPESFEKLSLISLSSLAPLVREIEYKAPPLIRKGIQSLFSVFDSPWDKVHCLPHFYYLDIQDRQMLEDRFSIAMLKQDNRESYEGLTDETWGKYASSLAHMS